MRKVFLPTRTIYVFHQGKYLLTVRPLKSRRWSENSTLRCDVSERWKLPVSLFLKCGGKRNIHQHSQQLRPVFDHPFRPFYFSNNISATKSPKRRKSQVGVCVFASKWVLQMLLCWVSLVRENKIFNLSTAETYREIMNTHAPTTACAGMRIFPSKWTDKKRGIF